MPNSFLAVMFDLDGTLADTLGDIANVGNHMLEQLGRPTVEINRYRYLAGQGLPYLVREALGPDHQNLVDRGIEIATAYQLEHGMDLAQPYDGIPQLLDELTHREMKLAVLSNKHDAATQLMITHLFDKWGFDAVWGLRPLYEPKPDPNSAKALAAELGIAPQHWLYLGDTRADMLTACGAGFFAVGVLWGFREEQELRDAGARVVINHPLDLLDQLGD